MVIIFSIFFLLYLISSLFVIFGFFASYFQTIGIIWKYHRWQVLLAVVIPIIWQIYYYHQFSLKLDKKELFVFKIFFKLSILFPLVIIVMKWLGLEKY